MKHLAIVAAASMLVWVTTGNVTNAQPGFGGANPAMLAAARAQTEAATSEIHAYLNAIGDELLAERARVLAAISTRAEADARRSMVRKKIIELVGRLPRVTGPVVVRAYGTHEEDGFRVENIAYESFPGYWVTANVYVPPGEGPFPALVIAPGHGAGKSSLYSWAANFATEGFVVLAIDPMGQGERMQHFDAELGVSKVEPSGEHEHANQTALLLGQHIARYWFADGTRGVDYLTQRKDVDAERIGTFGCSGGGTAAAYLAAMDARIRVAAVSSYITSFMELLPGNGPQDAEQTLPNFIGSGLDFADWVELAAPRPYAIIAFEQDFFPFAGARWTYEESRRFYSLYGAEDQLEFIAGSGGHCNLGPVTPQLLTFLYKHLKQPNTPIPTFPFRRAPDPDALVVTPTGQLATSVGGDTAEDIARKNARTLMRQPEVLASADDLARLQQRVRADVRKLAALRANETEIPSVTTTSREEVGDYRLEMVTLESEPGISLDATLGLPGREGRRPVILMLDAAPNARTAAGADFIRLVKSGNIVVALQPRCVLGEPPPNPDQLALGQYMPELLRAIIVGRTIVGMRVDDTLRVINWLVSRPDVDPTSVTLYGRGGLGMVALHAAAIDTRISRAVVENTLVSYRMALQAGLHKNLSEVVIPNVLRAYDVVDLLQSINPRPVSIVNPANPMGQTVRRTIAREELAAAFDSDRNLGTPQRLQLLNRGFREPLPIE